MMFLLHTQLLDISELCSRVLPKKMTDIEWNVVRIGNRIHRDITGSLMDVGVSYELGEKIGSEFGVNVLM